MTSGMIPFDHILRENAGNPGHVHIIHTLRLLFKPVLGAFFQFLFGLTILGSLASHAAVPQCVLLYTERDWYCGTERVWLVRIGPSAPGPQVQCM